MVDVASVVAIVHGMSDMVYHRVKPISNFSEGIIVSVSLPKKVKSVVPMTFTSK
jgi:hypothetical protein